MARLKRRHVLALAVPLALGLTLAQPLGAASLAASGAQGPTFTPSVRADAADGASFGQNEPQVTVDQTGLTYVTWQIALATDSPVVTTRDARTFSRYVYPDKGHSNDGDVAFAHVSYPSTGRDLAAGPAGANGVFFAQLGPGSCGAIEIRAATTIDQGGHWTGAQDAACQPCQVDRPWIAAYTPPADRNTAVATKNTAIYAEHHDFCASNVWLTKSTDGGATWSTTPVNVEQPGSAAQLTSACNSIPGGIAVAQGGPHAGRVFAVWSTSDPAINATTGCNYSQFQPFDHIFVSYSDDGGSTWTSQAVFNDPCDPNPPAPPPSVVTNPPVGTCQDVSELFNSVASDDAGNIYVAYARRAVSDGSKAEYDVYLATSTDGGATWVNHRVTPDGTGTHYAPWVAAGGNGGVDVAYYVTPYVEGVGSFNKPAAAPPTALWNVDMAQSLDHGTSWTNTRVSDHAIYFGDYCTTGISCGTPLSGANNWGADRILYDDLGVAVGPDGGARIAWTDAHDSWTGSCRSGPTATASCQKTHVYFACQNGGVGLQGETITGCGKIAAVAVSNPGSPRAPTTPPRVSPAVGSLPSTGTGPGAAIAGLLALAVAGLLLRARRRSSRGGSAAG
ncbi:MAG TPA: sialidase family protein [Mycobacteriales bacterium]|nr:sialidase family protein [Mycobacteriales bacterium]